MARQNKQDSPSWNCMLNYFLSEHCEEALWQRQIIYWCGWDGCTFHYSIWVELQPLDICSVWKYFGTERSSWSTQWLQRPQVLWLQKKPRSSANHHRACQLLSGVCADMLCLVFLLWTMKNILSVQKPLLTKLIVCSNATLQNKSLLLYYFCKSKGF